DLWPCSIAGARNIRVRNFSSNVAATATYIPSKWRTFNPTLARAGSRFYSKATSLSGNDADVFYNRWLFCAGPYPIRLGRWETDSSTCGIGGLLGILAIHFRKFLNGLRISAQHRRAALCHLATRFLAARGLSNGPPLVKSCAA